jgi:hypothetical protein
VGTHTQHSTKKAHTKKVFDVVATHETTLRGGIYLGLPRG